MSERSEGLGTWVIICMLGLCLWVLSDIYQEMKIQRPPEQVEARQKQEAIEAQTSAYLTAERQARENELKEKTWAEVGFSEEAVFKFLAHGYLFWLAGIALIISGPFLMSRFKGH